MKALTFSRFGGPEVLEYHDVPDPALAAGEALVRLRAIGLNFADVYRRKGNYHLQGAPPWIAGYEGAGEVVAVNGEGVRPGDRVGFADVAFANAELVAAPIDRLIPLPADISCQTAGAVLLQGLTAQYLTRDSAPLEKGMTVVVHAAAGGVGRLLVQIAGLLGARVIGLASSEAKLAVVRSDGADFALSSGAGWVETVKAATGGKGADVVYDSVGITLQESLAAARTGGRVVFYGMAGGDPAPVDPRLLMDRSLTLTGGDLWNVLTSREERRARAGELFGWISGGQLKPGTPQLFALRDGVAAHRALESRLTTGKILLIPDQKQV
jgi:NADPH:quinone reductase